MADARQGQFDVVMVWAFDRMARSVKHFLEVLDELNHLNIEFISFPREHRHRRRRWAEPWSSSSAPSPSWNAT